MSDRDELAALIYQHSAGDYEPWVRESAESSADAILARWRLVPVEPELPPELMVDTTEQDAELDRVLKRSLVIRDPYA